MHGEAGGLGGGCCGGGLWATGGPVGELVGGEGGALGGGLLGGLCWILCVGLARGGWVRVRACRGLVCRGLWGAGWRALWRGTRGGGEGLFGVRMGCFPVETSGGARHSTMRAQGLNRRFPVVEHRQERIVRCARVSVTPRGGWDGAKDNWSGYAGVRGKPHLTSHPSCLNEGRTRNTGSEGGWARGRQAEEGCQERLQERLLAPGNWIQCPC